MNKLEVEILKEMEFLEIDCEPGGGGWITSHSKKTVAISCANITIEFAKGFAEWISKNKICKQSDGKWDDRSKARYYLTTSSMIKAYIKTL